MPPSGTIDARCSRSMRKAAKGLAALRTALGVQTMRTDVGIRPYGCRRNLAAGSLSHMCPHAPPVRRFIVNYHVKKEE